MTTIFVPPHIEAAFNAAAEALRELVPLLPPSTNSYPGYSIAYYPESSGGGICVHLSVSNHDAAVGRSAIGAEALRLAVADLAEKANQPVKLRTAAEAIEWVKAQAGVAPDIMAVLDTAPVAKP